MATFYIVSARPKDASNHLNSKFKVFKLQVEEGERSLLPNGWLTIHDISSLIKAGNQVLTGKMVGNKLNAGAAVELELRISKNDTQYKISDMPDT